MNVAKSDFGDTTVTYEQMSGGWTCMIAKNGARGLDLTWKKDGKDMYKSTLTVSADSKTLTETGSAAGVSEKYKVVYDKQ